jgi:hypothetical protein
MIACIVRFAGALFDYQPLRITRTTPNLGIHVILAIAAARQPALSILKLPPADISGQWGSVPFLQTLEQVLRFERRHWDGAVILCNRWRRLSERFCQAGSGAQPGTDQQSKQEGGHEAL